jgi:hydrogenase-4 component B
LVLANRHVSSFLLAGLCLLAGILPGYFIDALAPVSQGLLGASMPTQSGDPYFAIVPIAESRSSYDGLLVFLFMAFSATFAAAAIHRLASDRLRRGPAWDCGYPELSPATQYTASSFAQPIRRVFGTMLFHARERVAMPLPGDMSPARFQVELHDLIWETLYAPVARAVSATADRLNIVQSLTIRRYLTFVFVSLVGLLLVLAIWP